jgi:adenylate cyclase
VNDGPMGTEIERKFLVAAVPSPDLLGSGARLRQGYLALDGAVEVRLRTTGDTTVLTVKAGAGLERAEVEVPLPGGDADDLWPHAAARSLEKVRHRIALPGGLVAELDRYEGSLAGLATVEVELPSVEAAERFEPPPWFGRELTGEPGWSNAELAQHGAPGGPP